MKDEREIIMTEWYGMGLEEGMSSRQNVIGKERSRVLHVCWTSAFNLGENGSR